MDSIPVERNNKVNFRKIKKAEKHAFDR